MTRNEYLTEAKAKALNLSDSQLRELTRLATSMIGTTEWWGEISDDTTPVERKVIRIEPQGSDFYDVTFLNMVGAVGLPDLNLFVRPKIPLDHFLYLSGRAFITTPRLDDSPIEVEKGSSFIEVVMHWFLDSLSTTLQNGLVRDYRDNRDVIANIRGRVHVVSSVRNWLSGRAAIDCTFDEFDLDTPLNRVLVAACLSVSRSRVAGEQLPRRAARLLRSMPDLGELQPGDLAATISNSTKHYSPAIVLAHQVLRAQGRSLAAGDQPSKSFLFHTPGLIERGIRNVISEGLSPLRVEKCGRVLIPSTVRVNPDLEIDRPPFTGDIKYKIAGSYWNRADLAQAVFFATAYGADRAAIVSFGAARSVAHPPLQVGSVNVVSLLWDVSSSATPSESAKELVQGFRDLLPPMPVAIAFR